MNGFCVRYFTLSLKNRSGSDLRTISIRRPAKIVRPVQSGPRRSGLGHIRNIDYTHLDSDSGGVNLTTAELTMSLLAIMMLRVPSLMMVGTTIEFNLTLIRLLRSTRCSNNVTSSASSFIYPCGSLHSFFCTRAGSAI